MNLITKLLLPVIFVTVVMSLLTVYLISDHVEQESLLRAQNVTAEYIVAKAQHSLTAASFQDADFHRQLPVFEAFMHQIRTPEILKIKVFNAKFDIIYSTTHEDIGKKTDSALYRAALLENRVAASIKPPVGEQANIELQGYRQLMEVYVPVLYDNKIEGVIEAYYKMDSINSAIAETSKKVIGLIIALSLTICIILFVLLTSVVVRPLRKLTEAAKRIAEGGTSVDLPVISGGNEIAALRTALVMILDRVSGKKKL